MAPLVLLILSRRCHYKQVYQNQEALQENYRCRLQ